jgi:GDPmannose 4,6-dehydratase
MGKAMVVGATGQDGALLSKTLLARGFTVSGSFRSSSSEPFWRVDELGIQDEIDFFEYAIGSSAKLTAEISSRSPEYVFFTAGDSFTASSHNAAPRVMLANVVGCAEQIEALRQSNSSAKGIFFGSSEIFGYSAAVGVEATELTPRRPSNPYGLSKTFSSDLVGHFRQSENMELYEALLFPHESPLRGSAFVVRKIVRALVRAKAGLQTRKPQRFGSLESTRDWGSARQYMDWLIDLVSGSAKPDAYIFATGTSNSVADVFDIVSELLDLNLEQQSSAGGKKFIDSDSGKVVAEIEARHLANVGHGFVGSTKKLFSAIGDRTPCGLRETIAEMIEVEKERIFGERPDAGTHVT